MMVNLYNTLTVIAAIWVAVIVLAGIFAEDFAAIVGIIVSLAAVGLILFRLGELIKLLVGG